MFVDSHCHLEMEDFEKDRKEVVERGLREGLGPLGFIPITARTIMGHSKKP